MINYSTNVELHDYDNDIHLRKNINLHLAVDMYSFKEMFLYEFERAKREIDDAYKKEIVARKLHLKVV